VAISSGLILIVATVAGILGFAARNLAGNIKALEVIASPKPVGVTGPLNILLMGTDTRPIKVVGLEAKQISVETVEVIPLF